MVTQDELINFGGHECLLSVIATLLHQRGFSHEALMLYSWRFYYQRDFGRLQLQMLQQLEQGATLHAVRELLQAHGCTLVPLQDGVQAQALELALAEGFPTLLALSQGEYRIVTGFDPSTGYVLLLTGERGEKETLPLAALSDVFAYEIREHDHALATQQLPTQLTVGINRLELMRQLALRYGMHLQPVTGQTALGEKWQPGDVLLVQGDASLLPFVGGVAKESVPRYFAVTEVRDGLLHVLDPLSETAGWFPADPIESANAQEGHSCWKVEWQTPQEPEVSVRQVFDEMMGHLQQTRSRAVGYQGIRQLARDLEYLLDAPPDVRNARLEAVYSQLSNLIAVRDRFRQALRGHSPQHIKGEPLEVEYQRLRKKWLVVKPLMVRCMVGRAATGIQNLQVHLRELCDEEERWLTQLQAAWEEQSREGVKS